MDRNGRAYEPPKAKIYRFDDNDLILTSSGGLDNPPETETTDPTTPTIPPDDYAANALNKLFDGTNTTIEIEK